MTEATPLKVAIVGTAPTSKMMAPYKDDSWQIWACSMGNMNQLPRVNVWFEIHAMSELMAPDQAGTFEPFIAWLKEKSDAQVFDVVMQEFNQQVPKAIPYPLKEMLKLFGHNWFTSSVAYMMAVAIARGAAEIGLFGVDMAADQEHYSAQRAGCTRFIEIAEERGIKVTVPYESCLKTETPLYGYWEGTPFGRRLISSRKLVEQNLSQVNAQLAGLRDRQNYFNGAIEQLKYFERTWTDGAELDLNMGGLEAMQAAAEAKAAEAGHTGPLPGAGFATSLDGLMAGDTGYVRRADWHETGEHSAHAAEFPDSVSDAFVDLAPPAKPNGADIVIGEEH